MTDDERTMDGYCKWCGSAMCWPKQCPERPKPELMSSTEPLREKSRSIVTEYAKVGPHMPWYGVCELVPQADALADAIAQALRAVRAEALEEAAKVAESGIFPKAQDDLDRGYNAGCVDSAFHIRAIKNGDTPPPKCEHDWAWHWQDPESGAGYKYCLKCDVKK